MDHLLNPEKTAIDSQAAILVVWVEVSPPFSSMFHQSWVLRHIAPPLGSSRESEKKRQLLGAFPGTRQSALRKQVQLCNATSTQTQRLPNQTQSSGTRVSGKLINQGKGSASKNRKQRRRTTTHDHPALEGRRALVGGGGVRLALINY